MAKEDDTRSPVLKECCASLLFFFFIGSTLSRAQDLAPRAYLITPVHSNAITLTDSFFSGNLLFDGTVPITGATAKASVSIFSFSHSTRIFARSANFTVYCPMA